MSHRNSETSAPSYSHTTHGSKIIHCVGWYPFGKRRWWPFPTKNILSCEKIVDHSCDPGPCQKEEMMEKSLANMVEMAPKGLGISIWKNLEIASHSFASQALERGAAARRMLSYVGRWCLTNRWLIVHGGWALYIQWNQVLCEVHDVVCWRVPVCVAHKAVEQRLQGVLQLGCGCRFQ